MTAEALREIAHKSIIDLATDEGILASARNELYGCVFGRDSMITGMMLLNAFEATREVEYLAIVKRSLTSLASLQGERVNIESGEEPGKCIHEYRKSEHEHLTRYAAKPWYVYPDDAMRSYDSVDATPLFLMCTARLLGIHTDAVFEAHILPHVRRALSWLLEYGDSNNDGLIDYQFHPERTHGGLFVQSWMDSSESLFFEANGERPRYPIAPVEVQAYAYAALRAWGDYFAVSEPAYAALLHARAERLKKDFKAHFMRSRRTRVALAFAIDGNGRALSSARSSMGHILWAAWRRGTAIECILDEGVERLVQRLFARDLFVQKAGFRTLSSRSAHFSPKSYHNGSIWPHDTALIAEGLENFGFHDEANRARRAIMGAWMHFLTPIELFAFTRGSYCEYEGEDGRRACRVQAWSAAALLATLSKDPTIESKNVRA